MDNQKDVREHVIDLLERGNAHIGIDGAIKGLSKENRGIKPDHLPYSIWQLVEHLRIAQYDIVEFSRNPEYQSPQWPDGYWPKELAPKNDEAWEKCINQIHKDHQDMIDMVSDSNIDLYQPFPHGNGQTLLREAMLIADHNAYHVGQIVVLRRMLGDWK